MKNPKSNADAKRCRPEHLFGVDHRLAFPLWAAAAEYNIRYMLEKRQVVFTEGLRDTDRQLELVKRGLSQTRNSKHIIGFAVDVAVLVNGSLASDLSLYADFWEHVRRHSAEYSGQCLIRWGGEWLSFVDGTHFEL